jgi:hypothetical protein
MNVIVTVALLQQGVYQGNTSPPSGDTVGYWQQRAAYTIVATLDEAQTKLRARGTLVYVNNSPDTIREMYFHQYLNAFRPGSKWSERDDRENRVRFQYLEEPDYGYERLTTPPLVNGTPVFVDYPGAPDSTVMHLRLVAPLAPHDSVRIDFQWDARPSVVCRRQCRKDRSYDFAQWYPKVAVYDRGGWEPNALQPAGELYGEFATYDVTVVVRDDQVLASTGVPVAGDPGWARVSRTGPPHLSAQAYGGLSPAPAPDIPTGFRAVRFVARDVHHFAWSASPDYRYEGTVVARPVPRTPFPTWDTVTIHVLYKPGDDTTWGGGRAVARTAFALRWLESIWGPYAYPQITNVHRLDGGGTEFPMMIMDGSASQGLILHEFGHVFTYGILANNEWRSGWMDEGLTDYQTDWAERLTPQERAGVVPAPPRLAQGYLANSVSIPPSQAAGLTEWRLEMLGRTQPIGTNAGDFHEFGVYNAMIYDRAKLMYGHLRDALGDTVFRAFMHHYYDRWALKHVDERAMRASAERACRCDLSWFFNEWVHETGLLDYALDAVTIEPAGGGWTTRAQLLRRGELRHPMPVGVHVPSGWVLGRASALDDRPVVTIATRERPDSVRIDPYHFTWDWDRRNDVESGRLITIPAPRVVFDWPALNQADRERTIVALSPLAWYSDPQGASLGVRARTNYLSLVDLHDGGIALSSRGTLATRVQFWARMTNLYVPGRDRPLMNVSIDGALLDGIARLDLAKAWDLSPFVFANGPSVHANVYATAALPTDSTLLPEQWSFADVGEIGGHLSYRTPFVADSSYAEIRAGIAGGVFATPNATARPYDAYGRAELALTALTWFVPSNTSLAVRGYAGMAPNAPKQRAIFASSQDPFETFENDYFRPRGAVLKRRGLPYLPWGGAGLRGFATTVAAAGVVSGSLELSERVHSSRGGWGHGSLWVYVFTDGGRVGARFLSDAGAGVSARGRFYDRDFAARVDLPFVVSEPSIAGGQRLAGSGTTAVRWVFSFTDVW